MQRSESIVELAKALCAAQAEIEGAVKGKENSHFHSKYADLGAVWDAIRGPLTKHGLSVVQSPRACEMGVEVETTLLHTSGEYLSDTLGMPVSKRDAHGFGSAITYARRFALMAVAGIAPVDDDGNDAAGKRDGTEPMGSGKPRNEMDVAASWKAWATAAGTDNECTAWLRKAKTEIMTMASVEDIDRFTSMETLGAKQLRALHDHHEKRYDAIMKVINDRRDELRNKEAA